MHELAVTNAILETAVAHARSAGASRVIAIRLRISELSHLRDTWLQSYFQTLAAGTIAEDARISVQSVQPQFTCNACGALFRISLPTVDRVYCTNCGSSDCVLIRGTDYELESIEVET